MLTRVRSGSSRHVCIGPYSATRGLEPPAGMPCSLCILFTPLQSRHMGIKAESLITRDALRQSSLATMNHSHSADSAQEINVMLDTSAGVDSRAGAFHARVHNNKFLSEPAADVDSTPDLQMLGQGSAMDP